MFINEHDLIGQKLKGRYKIEKIIGRGAMGIVYLAQDKELPDPLAIKVLLPKEATDIDTRIYDELSARFQRESALIVTLRHKHIVPVYDTGEHDGMAYFVMKYFAGGTLRRKVLRQGTLSLDETLSYIKQASSALEYIHFHGIVHRDIKPHNFLLDDDEQLVLTDFGVAHVMESTLTQAGQLWGTAAYASPEAKRGEKADRRDDIYSLGVVVYELLTGNHPSMVNRLHPNILPAVAAVILKATAAQRKDRYESAPAMTKALIDAIKGMPEDTGETLSSTDSSVEEGLPLGTQAEAPGSSLIDVLTHTWQSIARKIRSRAFPPIRSSRFKSLLIGSCLLLALVVTGSILLKSFMARTATSNIIFLPPSTEVVSPTPIEAAKAAVEQYYAYWNSGNYQAAYNLLQADYRARNS
jgi:serine/threonine protein kinase